MSKTIEQLRAEAEEAQRILDAAQEAQRAAEKAAKEVEALKAEKERREALRNAPVPKAAIELGKHLSEIAKALDAKVQASDELRGHIEVTVSEPIKRIQEDEEKGPTVTWVYPRLVAKHRGIDAYLNIEFKAEMAGGTSRYYSSRSTGRMRCSVGDYGERQSFPQKKDGSYNYDAISDILFGKLMSKEYNLKQEMRAKKNSTALQELKSEFGLSEYSDVVSVKRHVRDQGTYVSEAGKVFLTLHTQVTPEQARAILRAAADVGVKL